MGILMDQLHTPGNANYHKWLSEAEWDQSFGVNRGDVEQVVAWLEGHGFKVSGVTPDGLMIDFSGTAGMILEAFHTEIHNVVLSNGDKHIANISDPKIPAALADVVAGPTALHNFMPHPYECEAQPGQPDGRGGARWREGTARGVHVHQFERDVLRVCSRRCSGHLQRQAAVDGWIHGQGQHDWIGRRFECLQRDERRGAGTGRRS